jgi:antitoxin component of RelBE/YafQ-DinJ toxin-antitoxin module
MRTTVRLDDEVLEEAKRVALKSGTTLTAVFEEALREMFARRQALAAERRPVDLPTFKGRGPRRGIDLHDSAALLEAMEAREDAGA